MLKTTKAPRETVQWRDRPLLTMQLASEVAGVSIASLYRFAAEGRISLRRLGGRVVVETPTLIAAIEGAEAWKPSPRGKEARAKRSQVARAAFAG